MLHFITYCVGNLSHELGLPVSEVYRRLRVSGILYEYIVPCYDVLHTFGYEQIMAELIEMMKERNVA